jgi:hypothetical protein
MANGNPSSWVAGLGGGLKELSRQLMHMQMLKEEKRLREEEQARSDRIRQEDIARADRIRSEDQTYRATQDAQQNQRYETGLGMNIFGQLPGNAEVSPELIASLPKGMNSLYQGNQAKTPASSFTMPDGSSIPVPDLSSPEAIAQAPITRKKMTPQDLLLQQQQRANDLQMRSTEQSMQLKGDEAAASAAERQKIEEALGRVAGVGGANNFRKINLGDAIRTGIGPSLINSLDNAAGRGSAAAANTQARLRDDANQAFNQMLTRLQANRANAVRANPSLIPETDPVKRQAAVAAYVQSFQTEDMEAARQHVSRLYPDLKMWQSGPTQPGGPGLNSPPPPPNEQAQALQNWTVYTSNREAPEHQTAKKYEALINTALGIGDPAAKLQSLQNIDAEISKQVTDVAKAASARVKALIFSIQNRQPVPSASGGLQRPGERQRGVIEQGIAAIARGGGRR